jgi:hypothetical protein
VSEGEGGGGGEHGQSGDDGIGGDQRCQDGGRAYRDDEADE